jgi:hypothetical protein
VLDQPIDVLFGMDGFRVLAVDETPPWPAYARAHRRCPK